jgi:hypothetical protein
MTGITGETLEVVLNAIRRARGEWAIREMRQLAARRGSDKLTDKEINLEIKKVRQGRRGESRT